MGVRSYKRFQPSGTWDAIVIGSGIGGLTTAALLARHADKRVLVLERQDVPGGLTRVVRRAGYEWDTGLHYIGQIESEAGLKTLFDQVTGGTVAWARMPDCYERLIIGERVFERRAGREGFVDGLARAFPGHKTTLRRYLSLCLRTSPSALPFFAERMLPEGLAAVLGPVLRSGFLRQSDRTVEEVLRPRLSDPLLYEVLSAHSGDYGLPARRASFAIHAMVTSHFLDGAYYPVGGPSTLADGAIEIITRAGGALFVDAEVDRILIEKGRALGVRMTDGAQLEAPIIVSDAGLAATFLELMPRTLAELTGMPALLAEVGSSRPHVSLNIGLHGTAAELDLDGANLWIQPGSDREGAFARYAVDPDAPPPFVFVAFPSAKDPSFPARHPDRATVVAMTLAPPQLANGRSGKSDEAFEARMVERLSNALFSTLPRLRKKVEHLELVTHPSQTSAASALPHTPARFRLPIRARTPFEGLYLSGADLVTSGVAGAALGGAICAAAILRGEFLTLAKKRVFVRKPAPIPVPQAA